MKGPWKILPPNWQWVLVDDAVSAKLDVFDKETFPNPDFTYIDITSVDSAAKRVTWPKSILTKSAPSRATYVVRTGDILISTVRPNLNAVAKVAPEHDRAVCSSGFCVLRFKPGFSPDYFLYFFLSPQFVSAATGIVQGAMYPAISDDDIKAFRVPAPVAFEEQSRIAAALTTRWQTFQVLRASAERQLEAAENLHDGFVRNLFPFSDTQYCAEGWTVRPLKELRRSIAYGLSKPSARKPVGPKYVRITDIQDGEVNWDTVPWCECSEAEAITCNVRDGDILFARTGATTGKSYLISRPPKAVFASYLIRVQCNAELVLPEYLYAFFQSHLYWRAIGKDARGGAQAGFNASMINDMLVPLPPTKDNQLQIAREFQRHGLSAQRIERAAERQLEAISALPGATLRAFFDFGNEVYA